MLGGIVLRGGVGLMRLRHNRVTVEELKNHLNDNDPRVVEVFNNVTVGKDYF